MIVVGSGRGREHEALVVVGLETDAHGFAEGNAVVEEGNSFLKQSRRWHGSAAWGQLRWSKAGNRGRIPMA